MKGTVKWYHEKKGYGFIIQENGKDIFVHHSNVKTRNFKPLKDGDRVVFDVEMTKKGPEATNVDFI